MLLDCRGIVPVMKEEIRLEVRKIDMLELIS